MGRRVGQNKSPVTTNHITHSAVTPHPQSDASLGLYSHKHDGSRGKARGGETVELTAVKLGSPRGCITNATSLSIGLQHQASSTRPPAPGLQHQASSTRPPAPGLQHQASSTRPPAPGLQHQASSTQPPASSPRSPAPGLQPPAPGLQHQASRRNPQESRR
uniref:Uncharacterized protein n=1 Tax=Knipowitschia caucasica TaxID=637954 RepID=A0AAV2L884_KNICA